MITLYITAAGIITLAAAILTCPSLRNTPPPRTADQRGITLQTLIVTAVLVLMAVAAGVVIVAITNNAQDDLEGQQTDIGSRCEPWEIYDATLAANGRGGGNGGVGSSAEGCIRVCYLKRNRDGEDIAGRWMTSGNNGRGAIITTPDDNTTNGVHIVMSRTNIATTLNTRDTSSTVKRTLVVIGENSLALRNDDKDPTAIHELTGANANIGHNARTPRISGPPTNNGSTGTGGGLRYDSDGNGSGTPVYIDENMFIKVAPNQNYCHLWNTITDEEILRSSVE